MSIGIISMLTPFEERIERWVATGNATRILIHPEDWDTLSNRKREKLEAKHNLPVVCLGGERGYREWAKRNIANKDFDLESETGNVASNVTELDDE